MSARVRNKLMRRSFVVLGSGVAVTAAFLSSGTAAFAKSDISLKADHKNVKAGATVRFSGLFDDDASGVDMAKVCLWQYANGAPVRQIAPCVALHKQNGQPLDLDSSEGYFSLAVKMNSPGRVVVVPVVKTSYDPKAVYQYAAVTIVVSRTAS